MFYLLNDTLNFISNVMHYVLIGTIVLGCVFAIIFGIMIIKRLKYNSQMKKNKIQRDKLIRNEDFDDEKTP